MILKGKLHYIGICLFSYFLIINACKKTEKPIVKKDPIITWENPADIVYETLLSATQLNATANVAGTFVYTPEIGTKLNIGENQDLKVDFTPTDAMNYNVISKTVKINVIHPTNGLTTAVFNPDLTYGTMTDQDGNTYKTITIGTQTWMAENLRTMKYNDDTGIPNVSDNTEWKALSTGAFCTYENTSDNIKIATNGRLYNWYAVNSGKLAPTGWHVPTNAEWATLITYLGDELVAGGKMKETGTVDWFSPNLGATNESGFTAMPAGYRSYDYDAYINILYTTFFWSSTASGDTNAWSSYLSCYSAKVISYEAYKQEGLSVRLIKD